MPSIFPMNLSVMRVGSRRGSVHSRNLRGMTRYLTLGFEAVMAWPCGVGNAAGGQAGGADLCKQLLELCERWTEGCGAVLVHVAEVGFLPDGGDDGTGRDDADGDAEEGEFAPESLRHAFKRVL